MKLFLITHKNNTTLYVAAEDLPRAADTYSLSKSIELVDEKVSVLRNRDGSDTYSDDEWKTADSRFPPKEDEDAVKYIQRLCRRIVDVECSNRGYQSVFERLGVKKEENK